MPRKIGEFAVKTILRSDGGIVASIAAFQAVDLGSIPSHRSAFLLLQRTSSDEGPPVASPHVNFVLADKLHLNILQRLQPTAN